MYKISYRFVFWISGNDIMMKNLNGLESKTCTSPTSSPIALAVDVSQQLLYWLTVNAADSVASISQLEYAEWQCGRYVQIHVRIKYCQCLLKVE